MQKDSCNRVISLKAWPGPFAAVRARTKRHEVRKDDRDYRVGDVLVLQEWIPAHEDGCIFVSPEFGVVVCEKCGRDPNDPPRGEYTREMEAVRVTYKSEGGTWGLPAGLCVLSIEPVEIGAYA